ncbi:MAG: superoxide dismutase, Ni [Candidatus Omnitrophica bacterium]|nr:superoxide dismutase, Ni [Candidatus Omnitrophota bacterium]
MRQTVFFPVLAVLFSVGFAVPAAFAHCEIPCGIYDDGMKFRELSQHADTIEKSVREIRALEASGKPDMNQLVRWINNKDAHADRIKEEVADYFLSQRVKLPEGEAERGDYGRQLELLHRITVYAMKTKQTVDPENVRLLRESLEAYRELYEKLHGHGPEGT